MNCHHEFDINCDSWSWIYANMYFEDDLLVLCPECPKEFRRRFASSRLYDIERDLECIIKLIRILRRSS